MTVEQVAKIAGVSKTAVSFVINGKPGVSIKTAERIREAMREIDYVPRARNKRISPSVEDRNIEVPKQIGLIMPNQMLQRSPFVMRMMHAIQNELSKSDIFLRPIICDENLKDMNFSRLHGFIFWGRDICREIEIPGHIPRIALLGDVRPHEKLQADHVVPANARIGCMAADHLIDQGHSNIATVIMDKNHHAYMMRSDYFVRQCARREVKCSTLTAIFSDRHSDGQLTNGSEVATIQEMIRHYKSLKEKPTAIFVPSDSFLAIIHKSFVAAGIQVGTDLIFMGCNNESTLLDGLCVRPATLDLNIDTIALVAVEKLLSKMSQPIGSSSNTVIFVEPKLVPGAEMRSNEISCLTS